MPNLYRRKIQTITNRFYFRKTTEKGVTLWTLSSIGDLQSPGAIHHIQYTSKSKKNEIYKLRSYKNAGSDVFRDHIKNINWNVIYEDNDVNQKMNKLYTILNETLGEFFPIKTIRTKHKPNPWFTSEIDELMKQRKMYYDWWKINRNHQSGKVMYDAYKRINNKIKNVVRDISTRSNISPKHTTTQQTVETGGKSSTISESQIN